MRTKYFFLGLSLLCLLAGCSLSKEKQQEKIAGLEKSVLDENDTTRQQELFKCYDSYIGKFPDDSLSPEYLFRKAGILRVEKQGDAALDALAEIVNRYPQSSRVVECYFLRGLIYEEVFYDQELAKKAYQSFIDRYPDHPLADNARYSIRYLGMSNEEIIASFSAPDGTQTSESNTEE